MGWVQLLRSETESEAYLHRITKDQDRTLKYLQSSPQVSPLHMTKVVHRWFTLRKTARVFSSFSWWCPSSAWHTTEQVPTPADQAPT